MCLSTSTNEERYYQIYGVLKPQARRELVALKNGVLSKTINVREDGIRVGCTFITKEAVEFIIEEWKNR